MVPGVRQTIAKTEFKLRLVAQSPMSHRRTAIDGHTRWSQQSHLTVMLTSRGIRNVSVPELTVKGVENNLRLS